MGKRKDTGQVYLPAPKCHFLQPAYVQGEGHIFCQSGINFKDE